jgi:hypothetical protein
MKRELTEPMYATRGSPPKPRALGRRRATVAELQHAHVAQLADDRDALAPVPSPSMTEQVSDEAAVAGADRRDVGSAAAQRRAGQTAGRLPGVHQARYRPEGIRHRRTSGFGNSS